MKGVSKGLHVYNETSIIGIKEHRYTLIFLLNIKQA